MKIKQLSLLTLLIPSYSMEKGNQVSLSSHFPRKDGDSEGYLYMLIRVLVRSAIGKEDTYKKHVKAINTKDNKGHIPNQLLSPECLNALHYGMHNSLLPIIEIIEIQGFLDIHLTPTNYQKMFNKTLGYEHVVDEELFGLFMEYVRWALFSQIEDSIFAQTSKTEIIRRLFIYTRETIEHLFKEILDLVNKKTPIVNKIFENSTNNSQLIQEAQNILARLLEAMSKIKVTSEINPFYELLKNLKKEKNFELQKRHLMLIALQFVGFKDIIVTDLAIYFNLFSNRVILNGLNSYIPINNCINDLYAILKDCREDLGKIFVKKDKTSLEIYNEINNELVNKIIKKCDKKTSPLAQLMTHVISESNSGIFPIFICYHKQLHRIFLSGVILSNIIETLEKNLIIKNLFFANGSEVVQQQKEHFVTKIFADLIFNSALTKKQEKEFVSPQYSYMPEILNILSQNLDKTNATEITRLNIGNNIIDIEIRKDNASQEVTCILPNNRHIKLPTPEELETKREDFGRFEKDLYLLQKFFKVA